MRRLAVLKLRDELDSGTCLLLPEGVRKIIGVYCGAVFQTNFSLCTLRMHRFSHRLHFAAVSLHCLSADEPDETETEAAFKRLAVGDGVDASDSVGTWYHTQVTLSRRGQSGGAFRRLA